MKIVNFSKVATLLSVLLLSNMLSNAQVTLADVQGIWDIVEATCMDANGNLDPVGSQEFNDDLVVKRNISYEFVDSAFHVNLDATTMRSTTISLGANGEVQYDPLDHQELVDIVGGLRIVSIADGVMNCTMEVADEGDDHVIHLILELRP